jgi:hypothetical protein
MESIIYTLIGILALSGCTSNQTKAERQKLESLRIAEEQRKNEELDHLQCLKYGFHEGATDYAACRLRLDQQRDLVSTDKGKGKRNASDAEVREKRRHNLLMLEQMKHPGKKCTIDVYDQVECR